MKRRLSALLLSVLLLLSLLACTAASASKSVDLMEGIQPASLEPSAGFSAEESTAAADFGLELFRSSLSGEENVLISPISVLCALAMTANGAKGDTLAELEAAFGMELARLNDGLGLWLAGLPRKGTELLHAANALWLRDTDSFSADPLFLQTNANYYGAGVFKAPFDDSTCRDINRWVEEQTGGMIPELVDAISPESVVYLVNALSFEGEWRTVYRENQVRERTFTTSSGQERRVDMMFREENLWLETELATGFMKPYADGRFAFAALLPREGVAVEQLAAALTGEELVNLFTRPVRDPVDTGLPAFEAEWSADLKSSLQAMGVELAFAGGDFSGMGTSSDGPLTVSRVLHRTFIAVDAKGTRAGASTAVEMAPTAAPPVEEPKSVILNRPFLYFIVDTRTGIPVFMGVLNDPQ